MIRVGMISLGCSKNRVDAELMLGELKKIAELTPNPEEADVIIVNTCGFIESAKEESIQAILEAAAFKEEGHLQGLVVTGCLAERYRDELARELPEVNVFLGVAPSAKQIVEAVTLAAAGGRKEDYSHAQFDAQCYGQRVLTTPAYSAYVKIAEGCSNACAYCAIPAIRGPLKSRRMEDIEEEVRTLTKRGVREFLLIAQDTTRYGEDLYGKPMLSALMERLAVLPDTHWIRVLYCYSEAITQELLDTMVRHDNIVKYLDIPIQHVDDHVLRRMHRRNTRSSTYEAVRRIRKTHKDFILRTTLIAGFPGETEAEYEALKKGVEELAFDRLGVFPYSQEEGTPAAAFPDQLSQEVKEARANGIMELQQHISYNANQKRVGRVYEVLVEGQEAGMAYGRSYGEAPEIDGKIFFPADEPVEAGTFVQVRIIEADVYDMMGERLT